MALPPELVANLTAVSKEQGVDAAETLQAVESLVGTLSPVDTLVWGGPGFGQEDVLVDVNILCEGSLLNYCVRQRAKLHAHVFLGSMASVHFNEIADTRSPYTLSLLAEREWARVFGGPNDKERLLSFMHKTIQHVHLAKQRR